VPSSLFGRFLSLQRLDKLDGVSFRLRRHLRILLLAGGVLAALIFYLKTYNFEPSANVVVALPERKSDSRASSGYGRGRAEPSAQKKNTTVARPPVQKAWKELLRRYPKMLIEKKEEVHFSDGSKETWAIFRTSPNNPKLWILQETDSGLEAAVAGEILIQVRNDEDFRAFRDIADEQGFPFELENESMNLYRVRFDPEDMGLYRKTLEQFKSDSGKPEAVLKNRMMSLEP
jgi:hypothetical protein